MLSLKATERLRLLGKIVRRLTIGILIVFVSLFVLSIILSFLFPCRITERGRRFQCLNNLRQIGLAMDLYAADNNEERPPTLQSFTKFIGGDENVKMFMCPSALINLPYPLPKLISEITHYPEYVGYDLLYTKSLMAGPISTEIEPVMCDRPKNHKCDGINILFRDGHVAWWDGTLSDFARSNRLEITIRPLGVE